MTDHTLKYHDLVRAVKDAFKDHVDTPWFNTEAAAKYLAVTSGTLKSWRSKGGGPDFHPVRTRLVRYHRDDLDTFLMGGARSDDE